MQLFISWGLRVSAAVLASAFVLSNAGVRAEVATLTSGINLSDLDRTCKPCDNFYQFANGGWIKDHPIPASESQWGSFDILAEHNEDVVHGILESASTANAPAGSNEQKIGDFYASCMGTAAIDKAGTAPLAAMFSSISTVTDAKTLATVLAQLQIGGADAFFNFYSGADAKNSMLNIGQLGQSGLGMPDRDYYLKTDAKTKAIQTAYVAHVTKMFSLAGETDAQAATDAASVMSMETALATNQLSREAERDPEATYHKMDVAGVEKTAPGFDWATYFTVSGVTPAAISMAEPTYFGALSGLLTSWTPAQLQTYLRWHVLDSFAAALPTAFVDENFAFNSTTLRGTKVQRDRWKRCASATDSNLGEALGQFYVAKTFPPSAKAQALAMVKDIKVTLRDDMSTLSWMTPQTRQRAMEKLDAFELKIGYPDKWRDYSALTISRQPYASNLIASNAFETKRDYAKIDKPVDRSEWGMTPPTVNAYYDPSVNEIVFPAGILQPPFYDKDADMAVNFGGIGAVIGHESTHGFDDEGHQYDLDGNLKSWWTPQDSAAFNKREQCIIDQFDALSPLPGLHEQGKLVQGEATADLGGLTIAYKAFEKWQSTHPRQTLDGFTPEQRFFMGWAHVWASSSRPEYTRLLATVDVHAYDTFRVNATVSNMPQFAAAWGCKLPDKMVRPEKDRCQIW